MDGLDNVLCLNTSTFTKRFTFYKVLRILNEFALEQTGYEDFEFDVAILPTEIGLHFSGSFENTNLKCPSGIALPYYT